MSVSKIATTAIMAPVACRCSYVGLGCSGCFEACRYGPDRRSCGACGCAS